MSALLTAKISAVKRKHASVSLISGLSLACAALVAMLAITMVVDWLVELPYSARAAILIVNLSIAGYFIVRYALLRLIFGPDDETVSLWVEAHEPSFNSRLISSVQLSQPGKMEEGFSHAMARELVRETETMAQPVDFSRVVSTDSMGRNVALAVAIIVFGLIGLAAGGQAAGDLLQRALLVPGVDVPRMTRVIMEEGDLLVARGDSVTLTARAEGTIPDSGYILIEHASGRMQTVPMPAVEAGSDRFERTIEGVQESFTYRVHLNDGRSGERRVRVEVRPAVAGLTIDQIFPRYTGLGRVRRAPGDLSILEGSRLILRVRASKPVGQNSSQEEPANYVHLHGSGARYRLVPDSDDPTMLIAVDGDQQSIPIPTQPQPTRGFSIHLTDQLGLTSTDPTVYRLDLQPDRAPTVRVSYPLRRESLVTAVARTTIGFDAADDFALGAARIRYRISVPRELVGGAKGLLGHYFQNDQFTGDPIEAFDGPLDFDWKQRRDPMPAGMQPDNFTARWSGVIVPPVTGRYTFVVEADDGYRLWVNDQKLNERWQFTPQEAIQETEPVMLQADTAYPIRIEFRQGGGEGYFKLRWRRDAAEEVPVPREVMFPSVAAWQSAGRKEGSIELNLAGNPKSFRGYYEWNMQSLEPSPPPGAMIEWWLEVQDTNDQTGPGVAESERYVLQLVTPQQKRAELMTRLGEAWDPLDSVSERQQAVNHNLGQMIVEQARTRSAEDEE